MKRKYHHIVSNIFRIKQNFKSSLLSNTILALTFRWKIILFWDLKILHWDNNPTGWHLHDLHDISYLFITYTDKNILPSHSFVIDTNFQNVQNIVYNEILTAIGIKSKDLFISWNVMLVTNNECLFLFAWCVYQYWTICKISRFFKCLCSNYWQFTIDLV